jgi:farnesyl diphosphate synthase
LELLKKALGETAASVNGLLELLLPVQDGPEHQLLDAMRYATLIGGKRIRPYLVVCSARLFGVPEARALRAAAAVEMLHCYSLAHDDLPAMDDDALRRGQPTCHVRFDEATAILAGDALLTMAFEVLADDETHPDSTVRCALVSKLAKAAGAHGMIGGQMLDLVAKGTPLNIPEVARLQRLKTGMLIEFSCLSGPILGKASQEAYHSMQNYAYDLGLAFQMTDDLLDAEGDEAEVGKKTRKDSDAGKATFVSLLGIDKARAQVRLIADQAASHLAGLGKNADPLRHLAQFVVERRA